MQCVCTCVCVCYLWSECRLFGCKFRYSRNEWSWTQHTDDTKWVLHVKALVLHQVWHTVLIKTHTHNMFTFEMIKWTQNKHKQGYVYMTVYVHTLHLIAHFILYYITCRSHDSHMHSAQHWSWWNYRHRCHTDRPHRVHAECTACKTCWPKNRIHTHTCTVSPTQLSPHAPDWVGTAMQT